MKKKAMKLESIYSIGDNFWQNLYSNINPNLWQSLYSNFYSGINATRTPGVVWTTDSSSLMNRSEQTNKLKEENK